MAKRILILTGGSGVGKSTVASVLLRENNFSLIKATTSRPRREDKDEEYNFVTEKQFRQAIRRGDFLFSDLLFGNFYGFHKDVVAEVNESENALFICPTWRADELQSTFSVSPIIVHLYATNLNKVEERIRQRSTMPYDEVIARVNDCSAQGQCELDAVVRISDLHSIREVVSIIQTTLRKRNVAP